MPYTKLKSHFQLPDELELQSIYDSAPVFKVTLNQESAVLKETRSPLPQAELIMNWLETLTESGVQTVRPLPLSVDNPVAIGENVWVAYPFIKGEAYRAKRTQIESAGILLGQIHQAPQDDLYLYQWGDPTGIEEDRVALEQLMKELNRPKSFSQSVLPYFESYSQWLHELKAIKTLWVCGTWDYKANNLIFNCEQVTLIDPDDAGKLPRILDLALAVLLFHNELSTAPGRLFSSDEWLSFQTGYFSQVCLTQTEIDLWPVALRYMFMEEALWLILNDPEGWQKTPQKEFLNDLIQLEDHPWLFEFHKLK